eukprot:GHVT01049975.1.p1 GENE.GHVT01049975.1~~GHVT01049975.1.p1  ORF type:complete len:489 (+),score=70.52 GHVT01049975.1:1-1467(+)
MSNTQCAGAGHPGRLRVSAESGYSTRINGLGSGESSLGVSSLFPWFSLPGTVGKMLSCCSPQRLERGVGDCEEYRVTAGDIFQSARLRGASPSSSFPQCEVPEFALVLSEDLSDFISDEPESSSSLSQDSLPTVSLQGSSLEEPRRATSSPTSDSLHSVGQFDSDGLFPSRFAPGQVPARRRFFGLPLQPPPDQQPAASSPLQRLDVWVVPPGNHQGEPHAHTRGTQPKNLLQDSACNAVASTPSSGRHSVARGFKEEETSSQMTSLRRVIMAKAEQTLAHLGTRPGSRHAKAHPAATASCTEEKVLPTGEEGRATGGRPRHRKDEASERRSLACQNSMRGTSRLQARRSPPPALAGQFARAAATLSFSSTVVATAQKTKGSEACLSSGSSSSTLLWKPYPSLSYSCSPNSTAPAPFAPSQIVSSAAPTSTGISLLTLNGCTDDVECYDEEEVNLVTDPIRFEVRNKASDASGNIMKSYARKRTTAIA